MLSQIRLGSRKTLVNCRAGLQTRAFKVTATASSGWTGKQPEEHVVNRKEKDTLDVQADASKKGHNERATGSTQSQATSEKDTGDHNKKAKEDYPEAPGPVIGMNDERGGKGR